MAKTFVFSIGGSLVAPSEINTKLIKEYKKLFLNFVKKGNRVILIVGGGDTARRYQAAAKLVDRKIANTDLDWVGIVATRLNAELIRAIFGGLAYSKVLGDPAKKIKTKKKIIIGAGYEPGWSSDLDAILAARANGADTVINLTNVDYVYDKNPFKYKSAKSYQRLGWREFRKIVGFKWVPGAHVPFDPVAAKKGEQYKLKLVVMNGNKISNLKKFLASQSFKGTIIKN
ncbi:MAG: UMP kinase [Candidatus Buchananbacteria bacterium CG10_big_fil_rev_8_21_14_0_10_42_9]|uniref:UMP kinase n=1 Tax=Candidatus Buchananbacteria bacterium CG10_big_fil_rev_8_21_14_0_10_42_9 TaxID=1974526 RepID=A0A2H0VZW6_9BACT|nr:MAG: UMP kinase [Candidatus Buchananbacteria bacterium CG10_big_fil_rev_8_21_14_0_10_42_9]